MTTNDNKPENKPPTHEPHFDSLLLALRIACANVLSHDSGLLRAVDVAEPAMLTVEKTVSRKTEDGVDTFIHFLDVARPLFWDGRLGKRLPEAGDVMVLRAVNNRLTALEMQRA